MTPEARRTLIHTFRRSLHPNPPPDFLAQSTATTVAEAIPAAEVDALANKLVEVVRQRVRAELAAATPRIVEATARGRATTQRLLEDVIDGALRAVAEGSEDDLIGSES